jgi:hypothetical protein
MSGREEKEFGLTAPALDAEALVGRIRDRVEEKRRSGSYEGYDLEGIAALDFEKELSEEDFLRYYLQVVERLSDVNYGDFEIVPKGGPFGRIEVLLKKTIWKLLRFYTYRLFSQQREFDCQVAEALQSHYRWSRSEIDRLNGEISALRDRLEEGGKQAGS